MSTVTCRTVWLFLALACAVPHAAAQQPKPWTGGPTPALVLEDLRGRQVRLDDFRGKVVLVNFWATWCEPCRDEMPSIQRLRQQLAGSAFEVVAVNMAEPHSRVQSFLERAQIDLPVLLDPAGETSRNWRARILPVTFIVGPDGRIRYSYVGELDWAAPRIAGLIAALIPAR